MEGSRLTASKNKLIQPTLDMPYKKHSNVFLIFCLLFGYSKRITSLILNAPRKNWLTKICKNSIIFWNRVKGFLCIQFLVSSLEIYPSNPPYNRCWPCQSFIMLSCQSANVTNICTSKFMRVVSVTFCYFFFQKFLQN